MVDGFSYHSLTGIILKNAPALHDHFAAGATNV